jgi:hypothetical protein
MHVKSECLPAYQSVLSLTRILHHRSAVTQGQSPCKNCVAYHMLLAKNNLTIADTFTPLVIPDPDPNPDPHVFGAPGPDPLVR